MIGNLGHTHVIKCLNDTNGAVPIQHQAKSSTTMSRNSTNLVTGVHNFLLTVGTLMYLHRRMHTLYLESMTPLTGSTWFSMIDLKSGYWQIQMAPEDKEKYCLLYTRRFNINIMPFGLCNAPATFQCYGLCSGLVTVIKLFSLYGWHHS